MKDRRRHGSHVQMKRKTDNREPDLRVKTEVLKCNGFLFKIYVCTKVYIKFLKNTEVEPLLDPNLV